MNGTEMDALTDAELRQHLVDRGVPPASVEMMLAQRADPATRMSTLAILQNATVPAVD